MTDKEQPDKTAAAIQTDEVQSTEPQPTTSKKSPLLIIIVILLVAAGGYILLGKNGGAGSHATLTTSIPGFDQTSDIAYSSNEFYNLSSSQGTMWVYGYYLANEYYTSLLENSTDEYGGMSLDISNATGVESVSSGDLVLVKGIYNETTYNFDVSSITKISEDDLEVFNLYKYPYADITIKDYPASLSQGCANALFTVELTNTGKIPIVASDFYTKSTELSKYNFIQNINDTQNISYSYDPDTNKMVAGFENFETIQPGETRTLSYGGGGFVTKGCTEDGTFCGTGGSPNIFCGNTSNPGGTYTFQLQMGYRKPGSYIDYVVTGQSNTVDINIATCKCDLSSN